MIEHLLSPATVIAVLFGAAVAFGILALLEWATDKAYRKGMSDGEQFVGAVSADIDAL